MTTTPSHYDEVICSLADPRDRRSRADKVEGHGWTEDALAFEEAVGPTTSVLSSGHDFPHLYMTFPKVSS